MKKIEINDLPAGSIVLVKRYNLWQRFKALLNKTPLEYNEAWIDPFGKSSLDFKDSFWTKHDIFTFVPKKNYSKKEMMQLFEKVLIPSICIEDCVENILRVNLVRPNTFSGTTLEELLDNNKYYNKKKVE